MSYGWVAIPREIEDDWIYDDPFILKTFITLLLRAAHKACKVVYQNEVIPLEFGQLAISQNQLAKRLGCGRKKALSALGLLHKNARIHCLRNNAYLLITVLQFEQYQKVIDERETAVLENGTSRNKGGQGRTRKEQAGTTAGQARTTNNNKKEDPDPSVLTSNVLPNSKTRAREELTLSDFPEVLQTTECFQAWAEWLEYKTKRGERYLDTKQELKQLKRWVDVGPQAFVDAVNFSIASNYTGLFPDKSKPKLGAAPGENQGLALYRKLKEESA